MESFEKRVCSNKKKLDVNIQKCVHLFCEKQGFTNEEYIWIGNEIGGVVEIGDMYINFSDIRMDLERNITKGIFTEWYWTVMETNLPYINYNSWLMGLKHSDLKK